MCNFFALHNTFNKPLKIMHNIIQYKSIDISTNTLKDIDETKGIISGYFSVFGNVDSDGDMIMPGAFTRTLNNDFKRLKHLNQHNPFQPLSGTSKGNLTLKEDAYGLAFESTISQTSYGKDVIKLYADGVIDEHSIGFKTIVEEQKSAYNEMRELKLWEGSSVTWAANELAGTTAVKSFTKEQLFTKFDKMIKAFRNGTYENEEIFDMLELYSKQLQQLIIDLTKSATHPEETTSTVPANEGLVNTIDTFINKLKTA